jgi:hypothetical protein
MGFGPMRSPLVSADDFFESLEQFTVGDIETIRLVLYNSNPAGLSSITRTQPNVIRSGEPDLYRKMGSYAMRISLLLLQVFTKFTKACLGIFIGNSPFRGMLWIPTIDVENPIAVIYAQTIAACKPTSQIGDIGIEE